jgi:patatin-like phospholipase/acyl hydrolase
MEAQPTSNIAIGNEVGADDQKFRILSLDGGGVRGYLSATYLAEAEQFLDRITNSTKPLGDRFDLICGTSTGGIIALALATGKTAKEISKLYENLIPRVFCREHRRSWLTKYWRPRYRSTGLRSELETFFGKADLTSVIRDVCVTGVALTTGTPRFYKSDYFTRNAGRAKESLANIALGATAAPTYFQAAELDETQWMLDGGICCNNPAMVGITDALQFERKSKRGAEIPGKLEDLVMLSVGTGQQAQLPYAQPTCLDRLRFFHPTSPFTKMAHGGIWLWGNYFHEVAMCSQSLLVHSQAQFLLKQRYHRFDPPLGTAMPLDAGERINELRNLGNMGKALEAFACKYLR